MCGIAGIYLHNGTVTSAQEYARTMSDAIVHRGPDASGIWQHEHLPLALAHRRLSILDLSETGAQPMFSREGRFVIVFNGEIYNFLELRKQLTDQGCTFRGHSDTEILLTAIEQWGYASALQAIKGMFAFALWDKESQTLYLARDRIGEKPLYYGVVNGSLVFASELKAIYSFISPKELTLNKAAIASFLRHGYISAPLSIFEEIKKLPPGCSLEINLGSENDSDVFSRLQPTPYWSVDKLASKQKKFSQQNAEEALIELDARMNDIVRRQAIADVPLGAFLSGGIDSTLVSAVLQANSSKPIDTFTIGFHEKSFNEAEFAKEIAAHLGTRHHEHYVSESNILELVQVLPQVYDEPFADASQLPTILVNRFARTRLTVCLSGDGGDELFGGYNRYVYTQAVMQKLAKLPFPLRSMLAHSIGSLSPGTWDKAYQGINRLFSRKGGAEFGNKLNKIAELAEMGNLREAYKYLMSYWQEPCELLLADVAEPELETALNLDDDFFNAAMAWDQQWYLPGDNLVKTDRASMSASLELRAPLLDVDLIEFAWDLAPDLKVFEGKSKWLLRKLLYRYVPKELVERPKMGFSVPISQWIRNELQAYTRELLDEQFVQKQGLFDSRQITKTLNEHNSSKFDHGKKIWALLMFQAWYKSYLN